MKTSQSPKLALLPNVKKQSKPKPARESICLIETKPKDEWFLTGRDATGRKVWYLRFQITGMLPRRLGPFRSREDALLCLDRSLNAFADCFTEVENAVDRYLVTKRFAKRWPIASVEDDFLPLALPTVPKKGANHAK